MLPILIVAIVIINKAWPILIFFAVLAALSIGIYHLIKLLVGKNLLKKMAPYEKKIGELDAQHVAKKAEAAQSYTRYKDLVKEFMAMDPVPPKAGDEPSDSERPE